VKVKSVFVIQRELQTKLNRYSGQIAEKVLAKALAGDSQCLAAASALIIHANSAPQAEVKK
jgi:hypothetical protein